MTRTDTTQHETTKEHFFQAPLEYLQRPTEICTDLKVDMAMGWWLIAGCLVLGKFDHLK